MKNLIIMIIVLVMLGCREKTENLPDFIKLESTVLDNYNDNTTAWKPSENQTKQAQFALAKFIKMNAEKSNQYVQQIYSEIKEYKIQYVGIEKNLILCNLFKDSTATYWKNNFVQTASKNNLRMQVVYELGDSNCHDFQIFGTKE